MVDVGPLRQVTCPNGAACEHDIEQHRYEPDRGRWVCTGDACWDNPYRVVKVHAELSGSSLNTTSHERRMDQLRLLHGPDATFEFTFDPPPFQPDYSLLTGEDDKQQRWLKALTWLVPLGIVAVTCLWAALIILFGW